MSAKDWAERHRKLEAWANGIYGMWLEEAIAAGEISMIQPPTRAETIKHVWEHTREFWCESSVDGKLTVVTDPLEAEFLFELIRYGDWFVIECEGVVVQKMPVIS